MKKLLLILVLCLIVPSAVFAITSSVDRITDHIEPLIKADYIKGQYFVATSTTKSIFPYASSTAFSTGVLCLTADLPCRSTWPTGGSGSGGVLNNVQLNNGSGGFSGSNSLRFSSGVGLISDPGFIASSSGKFAKAGVIVNDGVHTPFISFGGGGNAEAYLDTGFGGGIYNGVNLIGLSAGFVTADRTLTIPDADGQLALTSDLLLLRTDGVNNSGQSVLDLKSGSNITLTTGPGGAVTIAASGGGGGGSISTSTALVSGQVDFSTGVSTIGNSANFLWNNTLNKLTIPNASTTALSIGSLSGILKQAGGVVAAATAGTDYQAPISLTTSGTSGAATFIANTLNIPQYTGTPFPFTPATNYGINTSATTTALWGQNSIFASSSSNTIPALATSNSGKGDALFANGTTTLNTNYFRFGNQANPLALIPNYRGDFTSNIDGYAGYTFANYSTGVNCSTDILFNSFQTTESTYYTDFGHNCHNYDNTAYPTLTGIGLADQSYWYNTDSAISIAAASTTSSNAYISFLTGGGTTANERMRIASNGNVGIGTTTPRATLSVSSTLTTPSQPLVTVAQGNGTATTTVFQISSSTDAYLGVGTSTQQTVDTRFSVQGNSAGSATKGTCFRAKQVGSASFAYWYFSGGASPVQTVTNTSCSGVGTTTITYD